MALKDWKRLSSSREIGDGLTWYYKENIGKLVMQQKSDKRIEVSVTVFKTNDYIRAESNYFTNFKDALKFAKAYMRKH